MDLTTVAAWLLGLMTSAVPPQDDDARARYEQWAGAVAWAAYNPDEAPVFQGPNARKRTAALMLAVSKYESGWSEIVLATGAERARLAKVGWNDGGRSWCYMQINLGKRGTANTYTRGWTGPELLDDDVDAYGEEAEKHAPDYEGDDDEPENE